MKAMLETGQQSQQKKRQRTIFDFAGMRSRDSYGASRQHTEKKTPGEMIENNPTDTEKKEKMVRTEGQLGSPQPNTNMKEDQQRHTSPTPDTEKTKKQ